MSATRRVGTGVGHICATAGARVVVIDDETVSDRPVTVVEGWGVPVREREGAGGNR